MIFCFWLLLSDLPEPSCDSLNYNSVILVQRLHGYGHGLSGLHAIVWMFGKYERFPVNCTAFYNMGLVGLVDSFFDPFPFQGHSLAVSYQVGSFYAKLMWTSYTRNTLTLALLENVQHSCNLKALNPKP